jgi:hypothetical protein
MKRTKRIGNIEEIEIIAAVLFTIFICSLPILPLSHAEVFKETDEPEKEYWESTKPNFPFTLVGWQLVTNPYPTDIYIDKRIIGTVKNNSTKIFSEIKIEFIVYDEESRQIAIVSSNTYNFRPNSIWKFNIPVTEDVKKAEFRGLYAPSIELKELENEQKTKEKHREGKIVRI